MTGYTEPEPQLKLLLNKVKLDLLPPPRIILAVPIPPTLL
jgi:hypothetical protein